MNTDELRIQIALDGQRQASSGLQQLAGDTTDLGDSAESSGGKYRKMGAAIAVAGLAIGTAAITSVKALYSIGEAFDDASDTIRVATGATGAHLDALQDDFRAVVADTPTDFDAAAQAVGGLNSRLGLTGKPLQALTQQVLELSRLTGTDLGSNIGSVTRLFGDWSVSTEHQSDALDKLFRASEKTGVPVNELADSMVKFGAPLRQLGFTFDQSAALIGGFQKEGVNTNLVMGSMRQALGRLAKAGKDPQTEFRKTSEAIRAAGSTAEANKIALTLFGAKAGPDMAAAIREGHFAIAGLTNQIAHGKDTIMSASADTADYAEQWQILKNRVWLLLEPVATKVFSAVGNAITKVQPAAVAIYHAFGDFKDAVVAARNAVRPYTPVLIGLATTIVILNAPTIALTVAFAAWGVVLLATAAATTVAATATAALDTALGILASPLLLAIAVIAGFAAGLIYAYHHVKSFRDWVVTAFGNVKSTVSSAVNGAEAKLDSLVSKVTSVAGRIKRGVTGLWDGVSGGAKTAVNSVIGLFNKGFSLINDITPGAIKVAGETIVPAIPDIKPIPLLATGGNVSGAGTFISGEAGAEAVSTDGRGQLTVKPLRGGQKASRRRRGGEGKAPVVQIGTRQIVRELVFAQEIEAAY